MSRADDIADIFPEENILQMDGYDDCIIGYTEPLNATPMLCYSVDKILLQLQECEGMEYDDALEHFEFNMTSGPVILVYTP
jgi:hypothetical protein